ncbi:hypothetical protein Tco_0808361 [Tanacetum coccineum]
MAELLPSTTEGYEDAIVIPEINANFELKHGLINLVQNKQFFGHDKEDPHAHIRIVSHDGNAIETHARSTFHMLLRNFNQGSLKVTLLLPKERLEGYYYPQADGITQRRITEDVQPLVVLVENQNPVSEPVVAPVSALMPNLKLSIPYPSRQNDEKRCENTNEQKEKFYEIFKDMSFEISFMDALTLMPKFASTLKALIGNKEKLSEMARTPLNEHCSAVILNKLPEKLADFVVIDFEPDPRVPLILGRCFLKTIRALIDVYEGELTLLVGNEAITYNLNQTSRYSVNYNDMTANRIDVVELACEE